MANMHELQPIIKKFESFRWKHNAFSSFQDALALWTFSLSNKFDLANAERREKQYLEIAKRYTKEELGQFADLFADVFSLLSSPTTTGVFDDYLGQLYMTMEMGNKKAGQFFTPYSVSKLMAQMGLQENAALHKDVITMNEPTCGAGGMIMAIADVMWNDLKINYADRLLVVAQDIDIRCVYMTYLQTALAGIPAVIYHGNTLTMQFWDVFYTPAYLFQWPKFKRALKDNQDCKQADIVLPPQKPITDGFIFFFDGKECVG